MYDIAFVAPECKLFLLSKSRFSRRSLAFTSTKKCDIYSIGVLIFMMITLMTDATSVSNALTIPKSKNFSEHIRELIETISRYQKYSNKLIQLLQKALEPNSSERSDVVQLKSLL
jgi:serine/threonine protein kinase